jgi:hypothetical protein
MTPDISSRIESAWNHSPDWNEMHVRKALEFISPFASGSVIDWDEGDEQWARVLKDNVTVAIIHAAWPLLIVHADLAQAARTFADTNNATVIVADNFDDHCFSVDRRLLERLLGRELTQNISYDSLSINDLWWATV